MQWPKSVPWHRSYRPTHWQKGINLFTFTRRCFSPNYARFYLHQSRGCWLDCLFAGTCISSVKYSLASRRYHAVHRPQPCTHHLHVSPWRPHHQPCLPTRALFLAAQWRPMCLQPVRLKLRPSFSAVHWSDRLLVLCRAVSACPVLPIWQVIGVLTKFDPCSFPTSQ